MPEPWFQTVVFERVDDGVVSILSLSLDYQLDEVWSALTDPGKFTDWLAPGEIELRLGGRVKLNFPDSGIVIDSAVSEFVPPKLLEYSWSAPGEPLRPLRIELAPVGAAVWLAVALFIPETEDAARMTAGWAAHLEMLAAALSGTPIKFPFETFKSAREAYRARLSDDQPS